MSFSLSVRAEPRSAIPFHKKVLFRSGMVKSPLHYPDSIQRNVIRNLGTRRRVEFGSSLTSNEHILYDMVCIS
jgi:hypothetical protein